MSKTFWEWFNEKQKEFDLNDAGLATRAGVDASVISKARKGEKPIGHDSLAKIAKAFRVPVSTAYRIAGYIEPQGALSAEESDLLTLFERVTETDQEEVLAILRVKAKRGEKATTAKR